MKPYRYIEIEVVVAFFYVYCALLLSRCLDLGRCMKYEVILSLLLALQSLKAFVVKFVFSCHHDLGRFDGCVAFGPE